MFAWTRATGKNISRCRMSTKNSIGTGLQRPVEISFSLMTMSNSVVSPTLNVSSDMLPAHRPPPFFRSLAADRFFINIDSSVIPLFLLIFISYAKFSSFILITTFLLLTSSFQDSCICQKKEKKKERRKERRGSELSCPSVAKSADLCSSNVHHCPRGGLCQRLRRPDQEACASPRAF